MKFGVIHNPIMVTGDSGFIGVKPKPPIEPPQYVTDTPFFGRRSINPSRIVADTNAALERHHRRAFATFMAGKHNAF